MAFLDIIKFVEIFKPFSKFLGHLHELLNESKKELQSMN